MGKWEDCSEYSRAFGERIKAYRMKNNFTQRQLGMMTNVNSTTISRVERGSVLPSSNMIHYLLGCPNCDLDELILGFAPELSGGDEFNRLFISNFKLPDTFNRTVMYRVRLMQLALDSEEMKHGLSSDIYREYMFNLKLAERICEEYHNSAEEGQVFGSIRVILGKTKREMSGLLELKEGRYGYLENHGHPTAIELVKLYDKYKINPAFVLSGKCEDMVIIRKLHRMQQTEGDAENIGRSTKEDLQVQEEQNDGGY